MKTRITARDHGIMKQVDWYRCLSAQQISRLFFTSLKVCRRRLVKLTRLELLDHVQKPVRQGKGEYIYFLTRKGSLLIGKRPRNGRGPRSLLFIEHHLGVCDFLISLQTKCKELGYELEVIPDWSTDRNLKRHIEGLVKVNRLKKRFIPDSAICIGKNGRKALFFLELDMAKESLSGKSKNSIESKARVYSSYLASSGYETYTELFKYSFKGFRVLFVVPDKHRLKGIKKACQKINPRGIFWLATADSLNRQNLLQGDVWHQVVKGESILQSLVTK